MEQRLQELVRLVERARDGGARGAEALSEDATGHSLQCAGGQIRQAAPTSRRVLTLRVWREGGAGGVATGRPDQADELLGRALAGAHSAEPDPLAGPVGRLPSPVGGSLGIDDRRYKALTDEARAEVLSGAEASVRQLDRRLQTHDFRYSDERVLRCFASTRGLQLQEWGTSFRASGAVSLFHEGETLRLDDSVDARSFSSIASLPFGTRAARLALSLLEDGASLSGNVRVMLAPSATARLFAALARGFSVDRLDAGAFFLAPREDGEPCVDPRLHLVDDATLVGGLRTRSFDDRGVPGVPLTLLREGRVDARFLDPRSARRLETRPTGHCSGAELRPSNLQLRPGSRSMNAVLAVHGDWVLFVRRLPDLELDLETGQFRSTVSGLVMKSNEPAGALRNVVLTGDLRDVLNSVVDLASDTDRVENVDAPGLLVDGFRIEG